jgi:hypothetical protein
MIRKLAVIFLLLPSMALAVEYPYQRLKDGMEVAKRTSDFQQRMTKSGSKGKLVSCRPIIESYVTKYRILFAGNCTLEVGGHRSSLMVCDDDMVGNFATSAIGAVTDEALAAFSEASCGGA